MTVLELKEYIYKEEKIEYILKDLGCHNIKYNSNKEYYSATQVDGDNPMGVVINNNSYLNYYSYSRNISIGDKKDLISFVEDVKKINFVDAIKYIHTILGLDFKWNGKKKVKKNKKINPLDVFEKHSCKRINVDDIRTISESVLEDYLSIPYIGWIREGVMPWTVKKFGVAFSYRRKRIIIPLRHWLTGELMGINSRTVVDNYEELGISKFFITPSYQKSINLFGLYENMESIKKAGYVVIYEAEKSVLKRDSLNDSTGVALSGHTLSDEQARILIGLDVDVIIAMDKDVPIEEVRFMCEKLYKQRNVYYIQDSNNLLGVKDSPADATNKIFQFFMKHKIKYDAQEHREYLKSLERK